MSFHQIDNSLGGDNFNIHTYSPTHWSPHFHRHGEIAHCLEGEVLVNVDGRDEILQAGQFALILPDQVHSYTSPRHNRVWIGVFAESYFGGFYKELNGRVGQSAVFSPDAACLTLLRPLLEHPTPYRLRAAIQLLAEQFLQQVPLQQQQDDLPSKIRQYVKEHHTEPITLITLASRLGYEYHYLSRRFHKAYGMNFKEYVNLFRFRRAVELLADNKNITEVALESGFGSLRSFHLTFSRLAGCSPTEYKKRTASSV